jgi:hypothetical protein
MTAGLREALFTLMILAPTPSSSGSDLQSQLPEDLWSVQAQQSVFMVQALGTVTISVPRSIAIYRTPLDNAFKLYSGPLSRADFIWDMILKNPARYLAASPDVEAIDVHDIPYSSGSAFAVGADGILLTNAHVVDNPDLTLIARYLREPFERLVNAITGVADSKGLIADIVKRRKLMMWYVKALSATAKFASARVILRYIDNPQLPELAWTKFDTSAISLKAFHPLWERKHPSPVKDMHLLTAPAKLIAVGEAIPGEDIAFLQVQSEGIPVSARNRLLCLPLGNSDDVVPGSVPIVALGFPGAAFSSGIMQERAKYRVNTQDGHIDQVRAMRGGWDAFEMTALIYHGHSGGPVIDRNGRARRDRICRSNSLAMDHHSIAHWVDARSCRLLRPRMSIQTYSCPTVTL